MKKILLLTLMLITQIYTFSQNNKETVYLKNGDEIRGNFVDFVPAKSVTIATVEGDTFVYDLTEVDKITRESILSYEDNEYRSSYIAPEKGYRFFFSLDFMTGKEYGYYGFKWAIIHGVQVNKKIFLGCGVGFCVASSISVPAFASFRFEFVENKKVSPFVESRAGYAFAMDGCSGFYGDVSFGCRFRRFSVSVDVETQSGEFYNPEKYLDDCYLYGSSTYEYIKQYFDFGVRLSVEF